MTSTSGLKNIKRITEVDEEEELENDISGERINSYLKRGLLKWQKAMEETQVEAKADQESISASRTRDTELQAIFGPDEMRIVRTAACISASEFRQRSYTDPTDLLWVFRRRCSVVVDEDEHFNCGQSKKKKWAAKKEDKELLGINKLSRVGVLEGCLQGSSNESLSSREAKHSGRHSKCLSVSSAESDSRDMEDSRTWTDLPSVSRKISAPACRMGRRSSQVQTYSPRRSSVAALPRRMARRGSEVPALTTLARRRSTLTPAFPVGLKLRGSRGLSNAEFHLNNIQTKAKHEMLANLVLPAFTEPSLYRGRERRISCGCHPPTIKTKKDEKRLQVTNEILETEKKYLACLHTLKKIFEDPMREGHLLTPKEIDIIFPNELGHIRESHTHFMKELEERIQNWKQYGIVGDIFTKLSSSYHIDVLKIYSDYVNNFPRAMAIINKSSRSSQKLRRFLEACSTHPECEGLDLGAYLLTPIQRLPRYVLLLRQLSKSTEASHPDSFHLENALEKMKNMINILNDSIQNSCKIVNVSISRKSTKRRSLRKRPGIKDLKITKEDNDSSKSSQGKNTDAGNRKSPTSPTSIDSPLSSPTTPTGVSSTTNDSNLSPGPESKHSVLKRVQSGEDTKCRPVSTGDLDRFYDVDHCKEFNAIVEEGEGNDKAAGQSKFRTAAESVKRSWQRRSKKWRRSLEGKSGSTSTLPELGTDMGSPRDLDNSSERFQYSTSTSPTMSPSHSLENTTIPNKSDTQMIVACNPLVGVENNDDAPESSLPSPAFSIDDILESVLEVDNSNEAPTHDATTIKKSEEILLSNFPNEGSPYTTHRKAQRKQAVHELRPVSVALPMKESSEEKGAAGKESQTKARESQCEAPESCIWVQRQRPGLQKRSSSDGVRQQYLSRRKYSSASSDYVPEYSTSIGSLDKSKESLNDSGVSGTPDNSPANTLNKNVMKRDPTLRNMERFKQLSLEERLGFEEIIAVGFGGNQRKLRSENELDKLQDGTTSKKKFKDVVKQMFAKKKRKSASSLEDALQAKKTSKILSRSRSFHRKDSKDIISTV